VVADIGRIYDDYEKTKQVDRDFQEESRQKQEERDAIIYEIRRLRDEQVLLGEDAKKTKQEQIDKQVSKLEDFDQEVAIAMKEKRNESVREIFQNIEQTLQQFGERKGYDLILNERAVLFRTENLDITEEILNELNQKHEKKADS